MNKEDKELKNFHVPNAKIFTLRLPKSEPIIDPKKYSRWPQLVMVTAVLSLRDLPKSQWLKELNSKICQFPSRKRIKEAEIYWIRHAQKEINFENKHIMKLYPFLDEDEQVYRFINFSLSPGLGQIC